MSLRQLGWVFGLLAALVAAWLAMRGGDGDDGAAGLDLGALVGPDVGYVRIDPPEGRPIELERREGEWAVNGYPALDSLVTATLAGLDTVAPGRLIARSAGTHDRLGLASESAARVRIGPPGAETADFLVGGEGTDGRFVRLAGEDASYVFPTALTDPLAGPESGWRDFTIARVDTASLERVVIGRRDGAGAELFRDAGAGGWTVEGLPADTAVMRVYLETVAELEATGFPADSFVFAADFERPAATVDFYGADPRVPDLSLLFATGLDHPDVFVRRADDPIVYAIDRSRANLLTTTAGRLTGGG